MCSSDLGAMGILLSACAPQGAGGGAQGQTCLLYTSLAAAVEDIFAQSAAARALGPRSRVLVKPNLLAQHAPEKAVTTHPAVLDALCAALRRRGVESITVADSPGGLYNPAVMKSIYKACLLYTSRCV